ncbi:dihydrodipicolinate synthase family protein [Silvibacterium acidisoli]|uniref:dihydrodipicolinate synthase family protein n=1 Tax=Acidobacteriaceae bacterium ZG23-2 TaxID=2883246 RepID=UPI00406CAAA1
MNWFGVMPAMTTSFDANLAVDHAFLAQHAAWLLENGCKGLVMLGSLGEGATLEHDEKIAILKTAVKASEKFGTPVIAAISSLSTANAVRLAKEAEEAGCSGLMVLPPYVYTSDWREMKAHVSAIIGATKLSCMLYNNPVAYKTDFLPEQIAELAAEHENLEAVKESSADVRRVAAIRGVVGDRLKIFVGVDDVLVEAVDAGATGWVAGLVNAFPKESVELFELALAGKRKEAYELYGWFLPLLRMDTVPKFVQLIKWVQGETGSGSARVRAPRLELAGADLSDAQAVLAKALANRPAVKSTAFPALQEA